MGLFGKTKKTISKNEFTRNVRSKLLARNLTTQEVNEVAMIFRADMDEEGDLHRGIDESELAKGLDWMRSHTSMHHMSNSEIDSVEEVLKGEL